MTVKRSRIGLTGHGYSVDGEKAPGVTTIIGATIPKQLTDWAARSGADHMIDYWDELLALRPSERHRRVHYAYRDDRDAAAKRGTEVHKIAALLNDDQAAVVPEELAGHVEAYRDFLDVIRPVPVEGGVELVVASREHRYCGTLDLIADLPPVQLDDEPWPIPAGRWLLEIKTTRSGVWPESALQSAGYLHADVFGVQMEPCGQCDPETRIVTGPRGGLSKCERCHPERAGLAERPMEWLKIVRAGVVWVKSDTWELRPVETGAEVWETFLHLRWLYDLMDDRGRYPPGRWIGSPVAPADAELGAALLARP